ncbi:MAG: YtxH domain-containing protein [Clostridium sp.]
MNGKFIGGMTLGLMVGAAAEMAVMPYMDKKTKRKMKKKMNMAKTAIYGIGDNMWSMIK